MVLCVKNAVRSKTKCALQASFRKLIRIVIADEADDQSEGMLLAAHYNIDRAPFFIVEHEGADPVIYTIYFKFVKEVLDAETSEEEELAEIINDNDLDFL